MLIKKTQWYSAFAFEIWQITNKMKFLLVGIGFAKEGSVAGLVVVLGGEPMVPEVCGDLFPVASAAEDKGEKHDARACLICLWNGLACIRRCQSLQSDLRSACACGAGEVHHFIGLHQCSRRDSLFRVV